MKTYLLLLLISAGFVSNAQKSLGIKAGLLQSSIKDYDLREVSGTVNFSGGLVFDFQIAGSKYHVQLQLLYSPMGYGESNIQATDRDGFDLGGTIDQHRVNFIRIPVYFLYRVNAGNKNFIKLGLGPWLAIKTGDRLTMDGGEHFGNGAAIVKNTNGLNSTIGGFAVNATTELSRFLIALEVLRSFNNLYDTPSSSDNSWKITGAGLSIGYLIWRK